MSEAERDAARNARLVHAVTYQEAIAGIFKPPPAEHRADFMGLFLNCVVAGALSRLSNSLIPAALLHCRSMQAALITNIAMLPCPRHLNIQSQVHSSALVECSERRGQADADALTGIPSGD